MSTFTTETVKCGVCGKESEQRVVCSTNQFGSPDLDLRPPEMRRSTMPYWVQECPHCGHVAETVSRGRPMDIYWVESDGYVNCAGISFISTLAKRFYRLYMTERARGEYEKAFHAALRAAWACDDANDTENAVTCRRAALAALEKSSPYPKRNETLWLQRADVLRRAGEFETVIREYADGVFSQELYRKIVAFQMARCEEKDTRPYTVGDVK